MKKNKLQIALALSGAAVIIGASFAAGAYTMPREVQVTKIVEKEVPVEIFRDVPGPTVEITTEVPVDNGNLQMVLEELQEKNGNVEYLTDGLEDDEVEMIVDRLFLVNEWESLSIQKVKEKLYDELDKEEVNGTELDEDDLKSLIIDPEDITFEDLDFDDKDVDVLVPFKLRQDEDKFEGVARVIIREGEIDDFQVDSINFR